jgi:hypothetical protein
MPRTAILYARSQRRDELDRQSGSWRTAGLVPVDTVVEVALGRRASKRCREVLADVAAGRADLMRIRDVSRLSENSDQLQEIVSEHRHRIAISQTTRTTSVNSGSVALKRVRERRSTRSLPPVYHCYRAEIGAGKTHHDRYSERTQRCFIRSAI